MGNEENDENIKEKKEEINRNSITVAMSTCASYLILYIFICSICSHNERIQLDQIA